MITKAEVPRSVIAATGIEMIAAFMQIAANLQNNACLRFWIS
jgi:hypothetical protein